MFLVCIKDDPHNGCQALALYKKQQKAKQYKGRSDISWVRKTLSEIEMSICFSSKRKKAEGIAAFLRALPADVLIKNSGSARESAGNNIKKGVHVAAAPAH